MRQQRINFRRIHGLPPNCDSPTGAGVIPFVINNNKLLFLLGREQYVNNWKGSNCWSGFEGGNKNVENCEENASREFAEETLCSLGHHVELQTFSLRICFTFSGNGLSRNHFTFLKQFDVNDKDVCTVFNQTRAYILEVCSLARVFRSARMKLPSKYPFYAEGDVIHLMCNCYEIINISSVQIVGSLLLVEAKMFCDASNHTLVQNIKYMHTGNSFLCYMYLRWFESRTKLESLLCHPPNATCVDHPSISITRRRDIITNVSVNSDYLEKAEIKWWSLQELRLALHENQDIFRPYFIPILKIIIEKFDD